MGTATSHPVTRPFLLWKTLFYLCVIVIQTITLLHYGRELDKAYDRRIEDDRQISTLIAENKRLRQHCPPEPTSGALANR